MPGDFSPTFVAIAAILASLTESNRREQIVEGRNVEAGRRKFAHLVVAQANTGAALVGDDPGVIAEAEIDDGGPSGPDRDSGHLRRTRRPTDSRGYVEHGKRLRWVV